jgi:hypothetical protein
MEYSKEEIDECRRQLKIIVGKKIETTMVAALNQFELAFGSEIGLGIEDSKLTQKQRNMRSRWNDVRNNIFNIGNQQKRNINSELEHWTTLSNNGNGHVNFIEEN